MFSFAAAVATKSPVIMDVGGGHSLVAEDIKDIKIYFYGVVIYVLWQIVTSIVSWVSRQHDTSKEDLKKFIQEQRESNYELKSKVNQIHVELVHIQATKADVKDVPALVREELSYAEKLRGQ